MITKDEIQELLHSTETYRVERTTSQALSQALSQVLSLVLSSVCPQLMKMMQVSVSVCSLFSPPHLDYFTRSQNNDSTNIIIISPNYHRIIHKNNLRSNRKKFQFEFENGEVLRLKLYEHLKI
jgi:hypothetical protein